MGVTTWRQAKNPLPLRTRGRGGPRPRGNDRNEAPAVATTWQKDTAELLFCSIMERKLLIYRGEGTFGVKWRTYPQTLLRPALAARIGGLGPGISNDVSENKGDEEKVSGVRCQVSGVRCQVSGVKCQASGIMCWVSTSCLGFG